MFLWLPVRKTTPFPSITAEKQTLQSKTLENQSSDQDFHALPTRISEPKSLRFGYPAGANVLEQEKYGRADRKMGLQAKERRAQITYCLAFFRVSPLAASFLAPFEPWGRRKSAKPGLERWQIG